MIVDSTTKTIASFRGKKRKALQPYRTGTCRMKFIWPGPLALVGPLAILAIISAESTLVIGTPASNVHIARLPHLKFIEKLRRRRSSCLLEYEHRGALGPTPPPVLPTHKPTNICGVWQVARRYSRLHLSLSAWASCCQLSRKQAYDVAGYAQSSRL